MKIGIEHEVGVLDQQKSLQKILGVLRPSDQYNVYRNVTEELEVAFDKEYYHTQYEVKFKGFQPTIENITAVSDYFGKLYGKNDAIQNKGPDFVGTHIHIFDSYGPQNKGLLQVVARVFEEMATFWTKLYEDDGVANSYKAAELRRLSTSNNLLKFLDHNVFRGSFKTIQEMNGISYQYNNIGYDKPKYAPVIWSPQCGGKEYSLELRYISNTYFLLEDPVVIKKLIDDCTNIVTATTSQTPPIEFYEELLNKIIKNYLIITALSYGIQNNLSLRYTEERILKQLSTLSTTTDKNELRFIQQVDWNLISSSDIFARGNPRSDGEEEDGGSTEEDGEQEEGSEGDELF